MNKQTKKFFLGMLVLFVSSLLYGFFRFIVFENFTVIAGGVCDPATQVCFVHTCDSDSEICAGDGSDTKYYSALSTVAKKIPHCDSSVVCPKPACEPHDKRCKVIPCTQEAADEYGDTCSTPEKYQAQQEALAEEAASNVSATSGDTPLGDGATQETSSTESVTQ